MRNFIKSVFVNSVKRICFFILIFFLSLNLIIPTCDSTRVSAAESPAPDNQGAAWSTKATIEPTQGTDKNKNAGPLYASNDGPDLFIDTVTWSPENPSNDDNVTISVKIVNQGSENALPSQLDFYVDGALKESQAVQNIEADASITKEIKWTAIQGSHTIKLVIDKANWILESDETNNEKSVIISTLTPDLIIESVTWSPLDPYVGENVTFTATVKNQGQGNAINPLVVFHVDGIRLAAKSVSTLIPGNTENVSFAWLTEADLHDIELIADPNDSLIESDETNNEITADLPPRYPDLLIVDMTWSPEEHSLGESVNFSVTFANQGYVYSNSTNFFFYVGTESSGAKSVPSIAANTSIVEMFTWEAEVGASSVRIVIDPNDRITESDETNNEITVPFSGTRIPDLMIDSITLSPANPLVGETITISVFVKNTGIGNAEPSHFAYYIDDVSLGLSRMESIAAGGNRTGTFTWTVQEGYHHIKVIVDSNLVLDESDEDNNEKTVIYPVPADLTTETISISPSRPEAGDSVNFTISVENQGESRANEFSISYYINGTYLGFSTVEILEAGITSNSTFEWTAVAGRHNILIVIDSSDKVLEGNEENNEISRFFSVGEKSEATSPTPSQPTVPEEQDTDEGQSEVTKPVDKSAGSQVPALDSGGRQSGILVYYILGLVGIILIGAVFFEFWRRGRA